MEAAMARTIKSRIKINGTFTAVTPLHVGSGVADVETDMPLARNGADELYFPGTGLTGVIRSWCERSFCDEKTRELIQKLFGPEMKKREDKGNASYIVIRDAVIKVPDGNAPEVRDHVGIDRIYGVAADRAKFDRGILPSGSTFDLDMTVEIDGKDDNERRQAAGQIISALEKTSMRFGGAKTRGLGKLEFKPKSIVEERFDSKNDVLDFLRGKESDGKKNLTAAELIGETPSVKPSAAAGKLTFTIAWNPVRSLMSKSGADGIGVDMLPVVSGLKDGTVALVLPGSSIKGAMRAQAERIMRTLLNSRAPDGDFHQQICGLPFVDELFGGKKEKEDSTKPKDRIGRGALAFDDCFSDWTTAADDWRKVTEASADSEVSAAEWELTGALSRVSVQHGSSFRIKHHTAIDRFTGGVKDGALYSVLEPLDMTWKPIEIELDLGRIKDAKKCVMLLLLVIRDLAMNRLPLGFATNRGLGEIKVTGVTVGGELDIFDQGDRWIKFPDNGIEFGHAFDTLGGKEWWT